MLLQFQKESTRLALTQGVDVCAKAIFRSLGLEESEGAARISANRR
jgi:hypothetical protein